MQSYLAAFGAAFLLTLLATRQVRGWAVRTGCVDRPDGERKTHACPIPRLGGVGIYVGLAAIMGAVLVSSGGQAYSAARHRPVLAILVGATVIFVLGLVDDLRGVRARTKFLVQVAVALGMVASGLTMSGSAFFGPEGMPGWLAMAATVAWIVLVTNAFNLIDGADGIAGGAALFAALAIAAVSLLGASPLAALAALTLAGATLGFLFFNFPPATIFLGDCGSLLLGFTIASIGLVSSQTQTTLLAVAIPVVSCGLPLLDTTLAVMRRFLRGQPLFNADRGHIHHRLRDFGMSPRRVAVVLYAASAGFALLSMVMLQPGNRLSAVVLGLAGVVVWLAVQRLRIPELLEVGRIVRRTMHQRKAIGNNVRIREALVRIHAAQCAEGVTEALRRAFDMGEFVRAELWVSFRLGAPLLEAGVAELRSDWVVWQWAGGAEAEADSGWEVRLPFREANGERAGGLSVWYSPDTTHVLTDLRLIARELGPAILQALWRLHARAVVTELTEVRELKPLLVAAR